MSCHSISLAEQFSDGSVGRRAFVTIAAKMPAPADGAKWVEQIDFNAADAILSDPNLKATYQTAIVTGCAVSE
jgi:hypothetical protein